MITRIYQINKDRDKNNLLFQMFSRLEELQGNKEVDASIYDKVYEGDLDTKNLEEIFSRIKFDENFLLYRGRSITVSDVVVTEDGAFYCEPKGWEKVNFDESKTKVPDNHIRVLYVEPHKKPYVTHIANTLEGQQNAVGGLIQYIYNQDRTLFCVNDEGKINGMEGNRRIEGDVLTGPFFVAGNTGTDICSLTDGQVNKYMKMFAEPEDIPREEVESYLQVSVYPMPMDLL